ncbi:hypothetical protein [Fluviispira sanaruensis]|uniref:Outer membrane protein beta-barrel domain-containing protein n=1 Tax=Fluviispira sanaruensis TaxID=2493639 RepID=A0A4P2VLT7_FLUSA|nr:hypothetical protein [Fluviispira sanaruensis]BBH52780.1 hypothetical protein JCM31447_12230 [Fluviispira sanaruensis]
MTFSKLTCYYIFNFYISFPIFADKGINISYGLDGQVSAYSVIFYQHFKLNIPLDKINVGYLIRLSNFSSRNNLFYTDSSSSEKSAEKSIQIMSPNVYSLNTGVTANVDLIYNISLAFNLDIIGYSFGSSKNIVNTPVQAKPAPLNLFLYNINDLGSLNSEFYVYYLFNKYLVFRAGLSHYFSEYITETPLADNSKRFRRISNLFFFSCGIFF